MQASGAATEVMVTLYGLTMPTVLSALLFALIASAGFATPALAADAAHIKDFSLPSATDGSLIDLSDFSGKVVLINYFRTECAYSRDEAPKLVQLYKKYHDQGFEILGVSDDHPGTIKDLPGYIQRYGIPWRIGLNDQGEFKREVFTGAGTPSNYLVSRAGVVTYLGKDWDGDMRKIETPLTKALAEPMPASTAISPRALDAAAAFDLPDMTGKIIHSKDLSGKSAIVAFFAADNCDHGGKELSILNDQFASRGLQVIGVDLFDSQQAVKKCTDKFAIHFPVLRASKDVQKAWLGGDRRWGVFFVSREGKVVKEILNWEDDDLEQWTWPKHAERLLNAPESKPHTLS